MALMLPGSPLGPQNRMSFGGNRGGFNPSAFGGQGGIGSLAQSMVQRLRSQGRPTTGNIAMGSAGGSMGAGLAERIRQLLNMGVAQSREAGSGLSGGFQPSFDGGSGPQVTNSAMQYTNSPQGGYARPAPMRESVRPPLPSTDSGFYTNLAKGGDTPVWFGAMTGNGGPSRPGPGFPGDPGPPGIGFPGHGTPPPSIGFPGHGTPGPSRRGLSRALGR